MGSGRRRARGLRVAAAALAVLALLAPGVGAVPWLQHGYDAARTGATPDPGPKTLDVAFSVQLPGRLATRSSPVVVDGNAYVLTASVLGDPERSQAGLWRIDLATAEVTLLADLGSDPFNVSGLASDGDVLYFAGPEGIEARDLHGAPLWARPFPYRDGGPAPLDNQCAHGTVHEGLLFIPCVQGTRVARLAPSGLPGLPGTNITSRLGPLDLHALDTRTGEHLWTWTRDVRDELVFSGAVDPVAPRPQPAVRDVAVSGEHVFVAVREGMPPAYATAQRAITGPLVGESPASSSVTLWALDRAAGDPSWAFNAEVPIRGASDGEGLGSTLLAQSGDWPALAALDDGVLFKALPLYELPFGRGPARWREDFVAAPISASTGSALAVRGSDLYVTSSATLFHFDRGTRQGTLALPLPDAGLWTNVAAILVADNVVAVLGNGAGGDQAGSLALVDPLNARLIATVELHSDLRGGGIYTFEAALSEGVLLVAASDGSVTAFGETPAGIGLPRFADDRYPGPGETVRIDLSSTRPGVHAADLEFRVEWGDGSSDEWTSELVFEHAYALVGVHTLTVQARNSAGQTASRAITVDVGGAPPGDGTLGAVRAALAGEGPWAWAPALFVLAVVAAGGALVVRERRTEAVPLSTDAADVYRTALAHALADADELGQRDEAMLRDLRAQLGLTERDHAILMRALLQAKGRAGALALDEGERFLGKYQVRERLAEGGQGVTYRAWDESLDREVVLKVLHPGRDAAKAILREARTLASVRHPSVVTVHDVDTVGDELFIVMEHVAGGSLEERLARGALDPAAFRSLARDLLSALAAVHEAGLVHRDVKPANVLLSRSGHAKLADFGIAHVPGLGTTAAAIVTTGPGAAGTPKYMSPEQARGRATTPASDLYAAALVLYEAWTGEAYFAPAPNESFVELQMRVASARGFNRELEGPPRLSAWFERALAREPGERFEDAGSMLDELEEALAG